MSRQRRASRSFSPNPTPTLGFCSTPLLYTPLSTLFQGLEQDLSLRFSMELLRKFIFSNALKAEWREESRFRAAFTIFCGTKPGQRLLAVEKLFSYITKITKILRKIQKDLFRPRPTCFVAANLLQCRSEVISCRNWKPIVISWITLMRQGFFPRTRC